MAHVQLDNSLPSILRLFDFRKELAAPLVVFTQTLLRGPSRLKPCPADRELIAGRAPGHAPHSG